MMRRALATMLVAAVGTTWLGCVESVSFGGTGEPDGDAGRGCEGRWVLDRSLSGVSGLNDVWGFSEDDIFAVGEGGVVVHFDGSSWTAMDSGTTTSLRAVWGSAADDVFAVGRAIVVHYDGSSWSTMRVPRAPSLEGVWGSSGSDVFAVGEAGTILHYDGSRWAAMDSGVDARVHAVWGTSATDVFAVLGDEPAATYGVLHYDGRHWSTQLYGESEHFAAVWGSSPTDVWAAGTTIWHYDGDEWTQVTDSLFLIRDIWGRGSEDATAVGAMGDILQWDGAGWAEVPSPHGGGISGIWGYEPCGMVAVAEGPGDVPVLRFLP